MVTHVDLRDTRNLAFGFLPFAENPGGESAERDETSLLDRATVRRSFKPVPYFNPAILVGADGVARVTVELPDNLTVFKLRAKAASGPDRFGFGVGQVAVRLPLIVQPALPRFVRPGDSFLGAAIGRVVEGDGGQGEAKVEAKGATLDGDPHRNVEWTRNKPERIEFAVKVPTPPYREDGTLAYDSVSFKVAVARIADGASDAFEAEIPVRDDRDRVMVRKLGELQPGATFPLPDVPVEARPGSVRRSVLVSDQPALVKMATGLDLLREYPYGCTEQRLSTARAELALRGLRTALHTGEDQTRADRAVTDTLQWLPSVIDKNGLCAYWPGGEGYVWLTAYAAEFLHDAKAAGYPVDDKLLQNMARTLDQSLRSDYALHRQRAYDERSAALNAQACSAVEPKYAAELRRSPSPEPRSDGAHRAGPRSGKRRHAGADPEALERVDLPALSGPRDLWRLAGERSTEPTHPAQRNSQSRRSHADVGRADRIGLGRHGRSAFATSGRWVGGARPGRRLGLDQRERGGAPRAHRDREAAVRRGGRACRRRASRSFAEQPEARAGKPGGDIRLDLLGQG